MVSIKPFADFSGGLNANKTNAVSEKDLIVCKNVFYNASGQLQTRRGYRTFGNQIGSSPITSFFFYVRDDNGQKVAVCVCGDKLYSLTAGVRTQIYDGLIEFESSSVGVGEVNKRVRHDGVVYKNQLYMTDGVNPYMSTNGSSVIWYGVGTATAFTVDFTTDVFTRVGHGLSVGDEIQIKTAGTIPGGLQANRIYYVLTTPTADTFTVSEKYNGTVVNLTSNGSGTQNFYKITQPRLRYMQISQSICWSAGQDKYPNVLYFTDGFSAPVPNLDVLTANQSLIGAEQEGRINGLAEYAQGVMILKGERTFYSSVASGSFVHNPIDSQAGGYSNRAIDIVGNSIVYFNESGIDSLAKRAGVDGAGSILSEALSSKIRDLLNVIKPFSYNSNCGKYIKPTNNYYFTFDSNGDDVPDTTVVYSSVTGGRSTYELGDLYDYGEYIDSEGNVQYLIASANGGQMFEFEYGFDDNGNPIEVEIQTKKLDCGKPKMMKGFQFIEVSGWKQEGGEINLLCEVDGETVVEGVVTDNNIDLDGVSQGIGVRPIATGLLGGDGSDLDLYPYTVTLPFFARGETISLKIEASGVQMIFENIRIGFDQETYQVSNYKDIL